MGIVIPERILSPVAIIIVPEQILGPRMGSEFSSSISW